MLSTTKAFSTFGVKEYSDEHWANVNLLLMPPEENGPNNNYFIDDSGTGLGSYPYPVLTGTFSHSPESPYETGRGSGYFQSASKFLLNSGGFNFNADFTVELWVKFITVGNCEFVGRYRTDNGSGWHFWYSSGAIYFGNTSSYFGKAFTFQSNVWYHLAVSRSSGVMKLFVNGNLEHTANSTWNFTPSPSVSGYIGNTAFSGYMTDIHVVQGLGLYESSFSVPTSEIVPIPTYSVMLARGNATIKDDSLKAKNITILGGVKSSVNKPFNNIGSLTFDGANDYLEIPNNGDFAFGTENFTIECWVYPTSVSSPHIIASTYVDTTATSWWLRFNAGYLEFGSGSTTLISVPSVAILNEWQHVAISRHGTNLRAFHNGIQVGSTVQNTNNISESTQPLRIGYLISSSTQKFYGKITNFRITKSARYKENFDLVFKPLPTVLGSSKINAEGGTVSKINGYKIHTFNESGTFTVNSNPKDVAVEYLVVGGGGGGGSYEAGGGGGGGFLTGFLSVLPATNYTVTVGSGGGSPFDGANGAPSSFHTVVASGGGGGGRHSRSGLSGGSGGGGGAAATTGAGAGTVGQGFAGGGGKITGAGGGGGAGGPGLRTGSIGGGGAGGPGKESSISGESKFYAGGGGGAGNGYGSYGGGISLGGVGGGGNGGGHASAASGGAPNTGGGGGGIAWGGGSGIGGSGIVIIRYKA